MRPFDVDSNTCVESVDLSEGVVSLMGTTLSGKGYEVSGDVNEVNIVVTRDEPNFYSGTYGAGTYGADKYVPIKDDVTYWLKFKIKEDTGVAYTVQLETVDVERTARILADDKTAKAIDAARVRVGAPEHAKFDFGFHPRGDVASLEATILEPRQPTPVMVHFYWTEKVVK